MHPNTAEFESVDDLREPELPAPARRFHPKDVCGLVFVLFSLAFGGAFALITPPLWGLDEATHFARAYQVDHGRILPQEIAQNPVNYGGEIPDPVVDLLTFALLDFKDEPLFPGHSAEPPEAYAGLLAQPVNAPQQVVAFANTSTYSPVSYVPSVLALRVVEMSDGSVGVALALMRLANVVAYTAVVWLGLRALREFRFKWAVFVVALLPMTVFEAAVITADAVTNALAFLFSALFVKAVFHAARLSRVETGLLFLATFLLPLAKPTYVLLVLLLPLIPPVRLGVRRRVSVAVTVVGAIGFAIWTSLSAQTSAAMHFMKPGQTVDPGLQMRYLLSHPGDVPGLLVRTFVGKENTIVTEFFGTFGNTQVQAPSTAAIATLLAGVLAFGMTEHVRPTRRQLAVSAAIAVVSVAAVFGTLHLEYSAVGSDVIEGVQGRYFIPVAIVWFAVLLRLIPLRLDLTRSRLLRGTEMAIIGLVFFALFSSAFKYEFIL